MAPRWFGVESCGRSRNSIPHFDLLAMVRLITHNLLACHAKGCTSNNFPLKFQDVKLELREAEYNPEFLQGFMPKIEWDALVSGAREVRVRIRFIWFSSLMVLVGIDQLGDVSLPEKQPDPGTETEEFWKTLHHVLMEVCQEVNCIYLLSSLPSFWLCFRSMWMRARWSARIVVTFTGYQVGSQIW